MGEFMLKISLAIICIILFTEMMDKTTDEIKRKENLKKAEELNRINEYHKIMHMDSLFTTEIDSIIKLIPQ